MKKAGLKIGLGILVIIGLMILSGSLYSIKEKEYAIVKQFGKIVEIKNEPGLNFKLPIIQDI